MYYARNTHVTHTKCTCNTHIKGDLGLQDTRAHAWRVQTVPVEPGSFQSRKPLPKAWMGIRDQELDKVSGIPGCIFVHASGFIGGNKTYEGTLEMARQGLTKE